MRQMKEKALRNATVIEIIAAIMMAHPDETLELFKMIDAMVTELKRCKITVRELG